jgi:hypothetical protein
MLHFLLLCYLWAFAAGLCGVIYKSVLAYEPVLNWWFRFGARYENKWFFAPVWGCVLCISGQLALWSFTLLHILPRLMKSKFHYFDILQILCGLILVICGAIFTAMILAPLIHKLKN